MPNWCENALTINGPAEDIQKFKQDGYLDDEQFLSAKKFLPIPESLRNINTVGERLDLVLSEEVEPSNWYDWCVKNWGTKWDFCDLSVSKEEWLESDANEISFNTAWSPPIALFDFIAKQYPTLSFKLAYLEENCWFSGYSIWENGKQVEEFFQNTITKEFAIEHMDFAPDYFDDVYEGETA